MLLTQRYFTLARRSLASKAKRELTEKTDTSGAETTRKKLSKNARFEQLFLNNPHLKPLRKLIPEKHLTERRALKEVEHLYLICPKVADSIVQHVLPAVKSTENHLVCETNAGLGLISEKLLEELPVVRMYETCVEFREHLKELAMKYPGRIELFTKDFFHFHIYAYLDMQDRGNRIESLLRDVPRKSLSDDPVLTVIGPMPKLKFLRYFIYSLTLQSGLHLYGRIRMFAIMNPKDYSVLRARPPDNAVVYQAHSILYNLFLDVRLLDKYPRELFVPWAQVKDSVKSYPFMEDKDKLYLVEINVKKDLPLTSKDQLAFFYFTKQFFGKGSNRVIPTMEKWVPGCGRNIIVPKLDHGSGYFNNLNIFTKFCELHPHQILMVFKEMINHPGYTGSPFHAMVESEILKIETVETYINSSLVEKTIIRDIETKFDNS